MLGGEFLPKEDLVQLLARPVVHRDTGRLVRDPLDHHLPGVHRAHLRGPHQGRRRQIGLGRGGETQRLADHRRVAGKVGRVHLIRILGGRLQPGEIHLVIAHVLGVAHRLAQSADAEVHRAGGRLIRLPGDDRRVRCPRQQRGPLDDDRRVRVVVLFGGKLQGAEQVAGLGQRHHLGAPPTAAHLQRIAGRVPAGELEQISGPRLQVAQADAVLGGRLGLVHHLLVRRAQGLGRAIGQPRDARLIRVERDQRALAGGDNQRTPDDGRRLGVCLLPGAQGQIPAPLGAAGRVCSGGIAGRIRGTGPVVIQRAGSQAGQRHLVRPGQLRVARPAAVRVVLAVVHEAVGRLVGAPDEGHLLGLQIPDTRSGEDHRRQAVLLLQRSEREVSAHRRAVARPVLGRDLEVIGLARLQPGQADPVIVDELLQEYRLSVVEIRSVLHQSIRRLAGAPGDQRRRLGQAVRLRAESDQRFQHVGRRPRRKSDVLAFGRLLARVGG